MLRNEYKILIIYYSSTGFTKKYAEMLKISLNADMCKIEDIKTRNLSDYNTVIFGSCLRAGKIKDLHKFMRIARKANCRILIFCTGAMDYEDAMKSGVLEKNARTARILPDCMFYCPGGLDFEHMEPVHKSMVEFYLNILKKSKSKSPDEELLARADNISFDATDKKYIEPIIAAALGH